MLPTFDENLVITAVQQLTTDLTSMSARIKKLEEGGGGGDTWNLVHTEEIEVSTTNTSETTVKSIYIPELQPAAKDELVILQIKDKAGVRSDYFYESISIYDIGALISANEITLPTSATPNGRLFYKGSGTPAQYTVFTNSRGVYGGSLIYAVNPEQTQLNIMARFNESYGAIDGTYIVNVYKLKTPAIDWLFD